MQIDNEVPFVSNAADDAHCFPASLLMIVASFVPELPLDLEIANQIASKSPGKAAWPIAAPLWLQRHGFDVEVIFDFDYPEVAKSGIAYIRERYGDEVAEYQETQTDLPSSSVVNDFLSEVSFTRRAPQLEDIFQALEAGSLLTVTVNSRRLKDMDGYVNHNVVVKGVTDTEIILHNPGLPPEPDQYVGFDQFAEAWSWPSDDGRYMMRIGRSSERPIDKQALLQLA